MVTFLALYRGRNVHEARLIAATTDAGLLQSVAARLLEMGLGEPHDDVLAALDSGQQQALQLIAQSQGSQQP